MTDSASTGKTPASFRKAAIIYNPFSGQGPRLPVLIKILLGLKQAPVPKLPKGENPLLLIQAFFRDHGLTADVAVTTAPGEGTPLAKKFVALGYDLVVAVGGDGTINEVVNGLAGSETALGVVPTGTVNVFRLQMRLPADPLQACRAILEDGVRRVDLGRVNGHYFICMAGIGFDAYVIRRVDSRLKKAWGVLAYGLVAMRRFFFYPFRRIFLRMDEESILRRGYFILVGNGQYYGGEMVMAPNADMTDGYLDVCIFKRKRLFNLIGYLWGLRRGELKKYLDVEYVRAKKITVYKRGRHHVHVDAEYLCRTPVHIEVVPRVLKVAG